MAERTKPAMMPRNPDDPSGVDRIERMAMRDFARRLKKIALAYVAALNEIPVILVVNQKYEYSLDPGIIASILGVAGDTTDRLLLEGGRERVWFFENYVAVSYLRGTADEFNNLSRQSPVYRSGQRSVAEISRSDPYRNRIALIAAREYEEMEGFSSGVKATMSRTLTDGIGRGLNPRTVAKQLMAQTDVSKARANRIARTEITTALRRARWDEHDNAQENYGIRSMLMHYSALSPTTRLAHAERHGNLYTSDEVRDWYSDGANSINCKCTQISVLVNANGEPLVPDVVERARKTEQKMRSNGRGPWKKEA